MKIEENDKLVEIKVYLSKFEESVEKIRKAIETISAAMKEKKIRLSVRRIVMLSLSLIVSFAFLFIGKYFPGGYRIALDVAAILSGINTICQYIVFFT